MKRARISVSTLAIAALIGVGFVAAPVGFDDQMTPEVKSAAAKGAGKSSGKGGGKKGGSKSSKGGKSGKSSNSSLDTADSDDEDKIGNGHIKAKGNGHAKSHDGEDDDGPNAHGKLSSSLGKLNAAHASPNARLHASENSIVGLLALYAAEVDPEDPEAEGLTPEEQRQALGEISNKSYEDDELGSVVDDEVVAEVNRLLGLPENEVVEDDDDAPVANP